jgi:putative membrane protein
MISEHYKIPAICFIIIATVFIWSGIAPYERITWWLEIAPVLITLPILFATYKNFRLTNLLYILITLHAIILMVGGHYTYARVPAFDWIRHITGGERNSFDGLGHLAQGFIPAIAARELLLRTSPLRYGKWMFTLIVFSCFGIAAIYEIIEWVAALIIGQGADEFLGTQGDEWDTQKDMALAGVGAGLALLTLSKLHDRALRKLGIGYSVGASSNK